MKAESTTTPTTSRNRGAQFENLMQSIGMPWTILAKCTGISETELQKLKTHTEIPDETYAIIAACLGVSAEDLDSFLH